MAETKRKQRVETSESVGYRRRRRPVPVRPWFLEWRAWPWRRFFSMALLLAAALGSLYGIDLYLSSSDRFRFAPDGSGLLVTGLDLVPEESLRAVFAADLGRPLRDLPLAERRLRLLATPWVRDASVARLWPDRIWAHVSERRPVAYVRLPEGRDDGLIAKLIDEEGVFLEPLDGVAFELPVVDGVDRSLSREERARRVELYLQLLADLDAEEPGYSSRLGSINVGDPENALVTTVYDKEVVELHLGDELFRHRFEVFLEYIDAWKEQFGPVGWVDLRLESQVVVRPISRESLARN